MWVWLTIFASFVQNFRFMLQKRLADTGLSPAGATYARFIWSAPLLVVVLWVIYGPLASARPILSTMFWGHLALGGMAQLSATIFMIALFSHRNFAVGTIFKRTEVLLSALVGVVFAGDYLPLTGWLCLLLGFVGVVLMSKDPRTQSAKWLNLTVYYGLGAGFFFGISGVAFRKASLALNLDSFVVSAWTTLACAVWFQLLILTLYLVARDRAQIVAVLQAWRVTSLVSLTSVLGSSGLFMALTLMNAAYVNAVSQVELIFAAISSYYYFNERLNGRELLGAALIIISAITLILYG